MALLSALLPALTAACASTVESQTGSTSSASANTTGGVGGASATTTVGVGGASATTTVGVTTTTVSTGGSGKSCGGFAGEDCGPSEFCDYPDNLCGAADGAGICVPRPQDCDGDSDLVCACDGKVYSNACDAAAAGSDVSMIGSCMPSKGQFACGPKLCASGKEYCVRTVADVSGEPDGYVCTPLPAACGSAPSCACLKSVPCGGSCMENPGGAQTVICTGG